MEVLRVRADDTDPLPDSFYRGTNTFVAGASTADPATAPTAAVGSAVPSADNSKGGAGTVPRRATWLNRTFGRSPANVCISSTNIAGCR